MRQQLGTELKQTQRLTPLQVQFVRMLEMPQAQAEEEVRRALEEMPALEAADPAGEGAPDASGEYAGGVEASPGWGRPDFFAVQAAMDAAEAAGGKDQALTAAVFTQFNSAYSVLLIIAFCYEALVQLITNGSTVGKLAMGLRTVPQNPARGRPLHSLLLCARSALKMLSLYLFQGFPFLICCLTIFTNGECRTGFDMAVKVRPEFRGRKFSVHR